MATAAGQSGVWAWTASSDDSRLWHYDAKSGATVSWSIGTSGDVLGGISIPAIAACGTDVWFGSNHTLVKVNATGGVLARYTMPDTSPIAAVDAFRPPELKGRSGVNSLACTTNAVAITMSDASSAFILDTASSRFTLVALPAQYESQSAAIAAGGAIGFGLVPYGNTTLPNQILVTSTTGAKSRLVEVADGRRLRAKGETFLVGDRLQAVTSTDTGPSAGAPLLVVAAEGTNRSGPQPLPDGRYVDVAMDGLRIIDPADKRAGETEHVLGFWSCPRGRFAETPRPAPAVVPQTTHPTTTNPEAICYRGANSVITDDKGNVYADMGNQVLVVTLP